MKRGNFDIDFINQIKSMIYKLVTDAAAAVADITDGSTLMLGGFGLCGIPENCIQAILEKGTTNLTCISNNAGVDDFGIGLLLQQKRVAKTKSLKDNYFLAN